MDGSQIAVKRIPVDHSSRKLMDVQFSCVNKTKEESFYTQFLGVNLLMRDGLATQVDGCSETQEFIRL